jgi:DNA-binding response OmpR family regulator
VLVVQHDRAVRELFRVHLQNAGYSVFLAPDAIVAGRTILGNPGAVDVLVVDAKLPYMSGIDFVSTLIADSSLRFIPIILITAEDLVGRADALGVPVLTAPFSAKELIDLVEVAFQEADVKSLSIGKSAGSMRHGLDALASLAQQTPKRALRIVVADDEPDTVTSLMAVLCLEGHSVFGSHHGADVMPEVRSNKPDAVILDIDMPHLSGYAIARDIRESLGASAPLLIAISGKWVGQTDRMLAELAGFDHFLQKPCHPEALLELLQ